MGENQNSHTMTGTAKQLGNMTEKQCQKMNISHDWERLEKFYKTFAKNGSWQVLGSGCCSRGNFGCRSKGSMYLRGIGLALFCTPHFRSHKQKKERINIPGPLLFQHSLRVSSGKTFCLVGLLVP